jgi:hypothetical protein
MANFKRKDHRKQNRDRSSWKSWGVIRRDRERERQAKLDASDARCAD